MTVVRDAMIEIDALMRPTREAQARDHISLEVFLGATLGVSLSLHDVVDEDLVVVGRSVDVEGRVICDFMTRCSIEPGTRRVYYANITQSLARMAAEAGLYELLWHPERLHYDEEEPSEVRARQLIQPLTMGLAHLKNEDDLDRFSPPPRRGSRRVLIDLVESYLEACQDYPKQRLWPASTSLPSTRTLQRRRPA